MSESAPIYSTLFSKQDLSVAKFRAKCAAKYTSKIDAGQVIYVADEDGIIDLDKLQEYKDQTNQIISNKVFWSDLLVKDEGSTSYGIPEDRLILMINGLDSKNPD